MRDVVSGGGEDGAWGAAAAADAGAAIPPTAAATIANAAAVARRPRSVLSVMTGSPFSPGGPVVSTRVLPVTVDAPPTVI
ncbi:hypothetical protein GCM10009539_42920 [Cryptosporangium japonicum]|uniref:Uncharacterized protein n=1 Tax=Cryptosporangium japonicum TaxID=80872 RepID=A0ABN0UK23_9ACTN